MKREELDKKYFLDSAETSKTSRKKLDEYEAEIEKLKGEVAMMERHWNEEQDIRGQVEHQLEVCEAMLKATEERNIELTKEKDIAVLRSMEKKFE